MAIAAACVVPFAAVHAQVTTDGSLGASTTLAGPHYFIDDGFGQTRGANLFHSFSTFAVGTHESATFASPPGIANIVARVTGGNTSNIDGQLSAAANLFLLNPQGVIFGAGATLNVGGSLHVSTADYLAFGASDRFYASLGPTSVLSFATPTAFGFLNGPTGNIAVNGSHLQGATGRSLSFITGSLSLTDAVVSVDTGRVNLATVGGAGEVGLRASSIVSTAQTRGPITLQRSLVNAFEEPGTGIYIRGGEFVVADDSLIAATTATLAQNATIDVDVDSLRLRSSAIASANVLGGPGADINVRAGQVQMTDSAAIIAVGNGSRRGGSVYVTAHDVAMSGGFSVLGTGSVGGAGGAGNVSIDAHTIDIADGGLSAVTSGSGNAGDITVSADRILLRRAGAMTSGTTSSGAGGRIEIDARELTLDADATARPTIAATTNAIVGGGHAGTIDIAVETLTVRGGSITSSTAGSGSGGSITVAATTALLEQNATIASESGSGGAFGPAPGYGNGGSIDIAAQSLQLSGGGRITTNTFANGEGGSIRIDAGRLIASGATSAITATTGSAQVSSASGSAGNIFIDADVLQLQDSAMIATSTFGTGGAGRIDLRGGTALVTDRAAISAASYGQSTGAGFANDIRISVERLSLAQGSQISNATHGAGAAGQLAIDAESVRLESGSSLQASSLAVGSAAGRVGDLFIDADQVVVDAASIQARSMGNAAPGTIAVRSGTIALTNGAVISAVSDGASDAGDIALSAMDSLDIAGFSQISTEASQAAGGNIALLAERLRIQSSLASTSVRGGPRDSGNVLMDSALLLLDNSAITARAVDGDGGRIDIAATFMLRSASTLIDASSQLGIDGEIGIAGFDVDLNADIAPLPADFLNAKAWLAQPCTARLGTDVSRLTVAGRAGAYRDSGDYLASPLSLEVAATRGATTQIETAFARLDGGPCR